MQAQQSPCFLDSVTGRMVRAQPWWEGLSGECHPPPRVAICPISWDTSGLCRWGHGATQGGRRQAQFLAGETVSLRTSLNE